MGTRRGIFSMIKNEYIRWLVNPRMILLVSMLVFVTSYVTDSAIACSQKMGEPLQIFELFIMVGNSAELCVLIPIVFLLLMGDFPRKNGNTLLYVHRMGKYRWLLGQILVSILDIVTYLGIIVAACMLMICRHSFVDNRWSEVATKYSFLYPEDRTAVVTRLLTGRLYNNFTPRQAFFYSVTLLFALLFLLSLIKIVFYFLGNRTAGVAVSAVLLIAGWIFGVIGFKIKWLFPLPHAVEWQHCDMIFRTMEVTMTESYLYFTGLSLIAILVSIILLGKFDFGRTERDGE